MNRHRPHLPPSVVKVINSRLITAVQKGVKVLSMLLSSAMLDMSSSSDNNNNSPQGGDQKGEGGSRESNILIFRVRLFV